MAQDTDALRFFLPGPDRTGPRIRPRIRPVFLAYLGCPGRCLFCAQHLQTGRGVVGPEQAYESLEQDLARAAEAGDRPFELAFYGGTFSLLPGDWTARFLGLAAAYKRRGQVSRVRCSTRPDAVDPGLLAELGDLGLDLVELGVQSFDDQALAASGRGYSGRTALEACRMVREAGLGLGVQLMPGLPGDRPGVFAADAALAAGLRPECARLYPCLVIRGTALAGLWERGRYRPWDPERTVLELSRALPVLWSAGVAVIRMGLAPEAGLVENLLAGPWHPALGQSVRARVLLDAVRARVLELGRAPRRLRAPARHRGEILGHGRELAGDYAGLGLWPGGLLFWDQDFFELD
ncbi:MAG: radical SAM protein [Desulfovibrionaceae bacterium]|nr:radical SAM protein [Desulfovibrionaceae bacterium]